MLLTKFYYAECSLLLSGNTRRVAVFQFHAYANQPWHSSLLKGHLKSQNFSLTFSLFPNERRRPTHSQIEQQWKYEKRSRQADKFPDERIAIPFYSHRLIWTFESTDCKKKSMFYFKKCCLENYIHFGNSSNHGRF